MEKSGIRVGCYEIWSWGGGGQRHAAPGWEWGQVWKGRWQVHRDREREMSLLQGNRNKIWDEEVGK